MVTKKKDPPARKRDRKEPFDRHKKIRCDLCDRELLLSSLKAHIALSHPEEKYAS